VLALKPGSEQVRELTGELLKKVYASGCTYERKRNFIGYNRTYDNVAVGWVGIF